MSETLKELKHGKNVLSCLAGVFMNFVLALVLLIGVYSFIDVQTNQPIIGTVVENSGG